VRRRDRLRSRAVGAWWLALLAGVAALPATGQAPPQVRAYVEPAEGISETTSIRLVLEVEGSGNVTLSPPRLAGLVNLRVVGGPSTSHNSVWSNGRFSSMSRLVYALQAEGPGPAEIPAIELAVGGGSRRTQPIRFEVAAARGVPPPTRPPGVRAPGAGEPDVFARVELGEDEAWVGQSVPLAVSLYAAEQVLGFEFARVPSLASFWVEELEVDPGDESYRTAVEGRRYLVYPLKRQVLVPQTAGEFEIEPHALRIQVRQRSSDPFDLFSFGRGTTVLRTTQPVKLRVRDLPAAGRPAGFGGAVGRYTLAATLDRREAGVNDAVALKATVEGEGFLGAARPPELSVPPGLKLFEPKVGSDTRAVRGRIASRRTWEWILVPLAPGELQLPELRFDYFDPSRGEYRSAQAALPPLVVRRDGSPDASLAASGGEVQLQRRELAFIKPLRGPLRFASERVHRSSGFLVLLVLPAAWVPLGVALGRWRARLAGNRGLARARRARAVASKRLRAARRLLHEDDSATFQEEVARALVEYVADVFDRSAAGLSYEAADELLASRGLDAEIRRSFRATLESCDFARFVPQAAKGERRAELLREATELVERLERVR